MKYNDITWRYFEAAPNAGTLSGAGVLRGGAGDLQGSCWVHFELRVQGDTVREARFQALGCPHTIALCAYLAERASGVPLREALPEETASLMQRFEVPEEKRGRLLLIEDAWLAALRRR